jgi:hypothetical protein
MNKPIEELIQRLKDYEVHLNLLDKCTLPDYKCYGCELSRGEAELVISALEKQIPEKPIYIGYYNSDILCPVCNNYIGYYTEAMCKPEYMQYCNECGQRIDNDWSGEDE